VASATFTNVFTEDAQFTICYKTLEPLNAHASHLNGRHFFGHNTPAAAAREVFKPSTDAESLLGSIKKNVLIWVRGSPGRSSQSGGVFDF